MKSWKPFKVHSQDCRRAEVMLVTNRFLDTERCEHCRDLYEAERNLAALLGPRFAPHLNPEDLEG